MIGGPTSDAATTNAHDDHAEHGEPVAPQPPPRILPQRRADDGSSVDGVTARRHVRRHRQYLTRGSMKPYAMSTSRLKISTTIEMNATMPMMSGSSRFRFALMK